MVLLKQNAEIFIMTLDQPLIRIPSFVSW